MADPLVLLSDLYRTLAPGEEVERPVLFSLSRRVADDGCTLPAAAFADLAERCGLSAVVAAGPEDGTREVAFRQSSPPPRWRVSDLREEELSRYTKLFKDVFNVEMPEPFWRWKYGAGRGHCTLVWAGDRLVAHYGGITRPIRLFGAAALATQIADVMVDPQERGVLTRKGPFFLSVSSFLDLYIGDGSKHVLGFGFPNGRHMRLADKLGLYAEVGRVVEMAWTPRSSGVRAIDRLRTVAVDQQNFHRLRGRIDRLWERMAADFRDAVIGVRDSEFVAHRYLHHPLHRNHIRLVTEGWLRRPIGLFVVRQEGPRCELLDLIGPQSSFGKLIWCARALAQQLGAEQLFSWVTRQYQAQFEQEGFSVHDPDVSIPTNIWSPGMAPKRIRDRWFLMGGDTDFH